MTDMSSGSNPTISRIVPTLEKPPVGKVTETTAFSYPPDVPITRTTGMESQTARLSPFFDAESIAPMVEDLQFLQWMVLTGRIFDPQSFPRTLLPEDQGANPLQEYFSSPY